MTCLNPAELTPGNRAAVHLTESAAMPNTASVAAEVVGVIGPTGAPVTVIMEVENGARFHLRPEGGGWVDGWGRAATLTPEGTGAPSGWPGEQARLARLIFEADNHGSPDPAKEWALAVKAGMVEYAYRIAAALIAAGYSK